jgi:hypothetical protein
MNYLNITDKTVANRDPAMEFTININLMVFKDNTFSLNYIIYNGRNIY